MSEDSTPPPPVPQGSYQNDVSGVPAKSGMSKGVLWGCIIAPIIGLVLLTVIAILASIAVPAYNGITVRAEQTKDLSDLKQIALATKIYAIDYDGKAPSNLEVLVTDGYLPTDTFFYDRKGEPKPIEYLLEGGEILDDLPGDQVILRHVLERSGKVITVSADYSGKISNALPSPEAYPSSQ